MRRNYQDLHKQLLSGRKNYFAESLTDYISNFDSVSSGRNGIITQIAGIYKVKFIDEEKYFSEARFNIGMCIKHPMLYHSFVELGYSILNPQNEDENLELGIDIMTIINSGYNSLDLMKKVIKPIINPVISYQINGRTHIIKSFEKSKRNPVQLKLVVNS